MEVFGNFEFARNPVLVRLESPDQALLAAKVIRAEPDHQAPAPEIPPRSSV
jgi:hypothetical protein